MLRRCIEKCFNLMVILFCVGPYSESPPCTVIRSYGVNLRILTSADTGIILPMGWLTDKAYNLGLHY